jgi:hypothetical protein
MDPAWLFPWLAGAFGIAALVRWQRTGSLRAARAWLILGLLFGAVSIWLHLMR